MKQFVKTYFEFILDLNILEKTGDVSMTKLPQNHLDTFREYGDYEWNMCECLLKELVDLQVAIKYEQNPKAVIIAKLLLFVEGSDDWSE